MISNKNCQIALLAIPLFLSGCGGIPKGDPTPFTRQDSAPTRTVDLSNIADAIPRAEPRSRYGNPNSYVVFGKRYYVKKSSAGHVERGIASWYGTKFHGKRTSSGEPYDMLAMTAAHKTLPLPTYVEVVNLKNSRKIIVKVNDRGPFVKNRIIDLSYAAAKRLGITQAGTGLVEIRAIDPTKSLASSKAVVAKKALPPQSAKLKQITPDQRIGIYLQVGAFSNRYNAENLRTRIRDIKTLPAAKINVTQGVKANTSIFRVRIGPLDNVPETDQLIKRLAQLGIENPHVVID